MSAPGAAAPPQGRFQLIVDEVPLAVPRDALLTLEEACDLPRLMGHFNKRHLARAIDEGRGPLRGYQPTKRGWFTTPADIDNWILASCPSRPDDTASNPDSGMTPPRTDGSSSTARNARTLAAAMAKAEQLSKS